MSATSRSLCDRLEVLGRRLDDALRVEAAMVRALEGHEQALLSGAVERIHAANAALDRVYAELLEVGAACREAAVAALPDAEREAFAAGAATPRLTDVLRALPREADSMRAALERRKTDLVAKRRELAGRGARCTLVARASLDALHGIARALDGSTDPAAAAGALDARV